MKHLLGQLLAFIILLALLAACPLLISSGGRNDADPLVIHLREDGKEPEQETVTATPTCTPTATVTATCTPTSTPTPTPEPEPEPTETTDETAALTTEEAPASTLTPSPTPTPTPSPTPTATPTPTPTPTPRALPMDEFSIGSEPKKEGYSDQGYSDETITVKMYREKMTYPNGSGGTYNAVYNVAEITIASPSQLRTAVAGDAKRLHSLPFTALAYMNRGVVSINGDFYGHRNGSYIVRQGQLISDENTSALDMLIIDYQGNFHIFYAEEKEAGLASMKGNIYQAFGFGPALVVDGVLNDTLGTKSYGFGSLAFNPRTAIGQIDELHYIAVVVEGRNNYSGGVTVETLGEYMLEKGCVQAYNLDGGGSSGMYFNNKLYSHLTNTGERSMYDIVYFASAAE